MRQYTLRRQINHTINKNTFPFRENSPDLTQEKEHSIPLRGRRGGARAAAQALNTLRDVLGI